jgi:hypothetical protein
VLGAGLTIQPRKKVTVKKPQKGEARDRLGLWSLMMMMIVGFKSIYIYIP